MPFLNRCFDSTLKTLGSENNTLLLPQDKDTHVFIWRFLFAPAGLSNNLRAIFVKANLKGGERYDN
ncbi:hypothetical protein CHH92_11485 [Bacillus sonorensis]|uniref:Uncharacterized protein n=1 Tax=Bacillus sonorensis L12 TaxID=1274524 RepID=M5PF05_9BACI|nr:hypothetical protein BSONL12_08867 [Bacillus sonorensis L12]MBG9916018.1 hypothetical protein [Bacillus sonorensis]PAD59814.1 hypothetical protein CHH92_11485 [Bacillus sonorensis]